MSLVNYINKPNLDIPSGNNNLSDQVDKRIRIRCRPGQENIIYGDPSLPTNPMTILHQTNGIIFPFTPHITVRQQPIWTSQNLTHSLQDYYYFKSIQSTEIDIVGKFTAQNNYEGRYLLAVLHFLRSYSKMYFGTSETESKRGLPPPILLLDGYGNYIFNSLPVIITNWNFEFPSDVDYVKVVLDISDRTPVNNQNLLNQSQTFYQRYSGETIQRKTMESPKFIVDDQNVFNKNLNSNYEERLSQINERIENIRKSEERGNVTSYNLFNQNILNQNINTQRTLPQLLSRNFINSTSNYNYAYLPAITSISISLVVQRPPVTLKREFNLQDFREGKLILRKGFI